MALPVKSTVQEVVQAMKDSIPFELGSMTSFNFADAYYDRATAEEYRLFTEALKNNTTITYLKSCYLFELANAVCLAHALKSNATLTTLDLEMKVPQLNAGIALLDGLQSNRGIRTLNLNYNYQLGPQFAQKLSDCLVINRHITTLSLVFCGLGNQGARSIGEMLKNNSTLAVLDLSRNEIESEGCQAISDGLKYNRTLKSLNLSDNKAGDGGAMDLASALQMNQGLESLHLGGSTNMQGNYITDSGASALAMALRNNERLTSLDLSKNSMTISSFMDFTSSLRLNYKLRTLNLSGNSIGCREPAQWDSVVDNLKQNSSLTVLNLANTYVDTDMKDVLNRVRRGASNTGPNMILQNHMDSIINDIMANPDKIYGNW